MGKRKTPMLAYCEYVSPDPNNSTQVWRARSELIDASKRVYPRFLKKLATDVLPLYRSLANQGFEFDRILWVRSGLSSYELLRESALKSALAKWAEEFNAGMATWLLDEALRTLRFWYVAPEKLELLEWFKMHAHSGTASTGKRLAFESEGWETELLTWARYSQSVRQRFEEALMDYEMQTRKLAESRGLVRARQKYSPHNLEWFVLYQFGGLSSTAIARRWSNGNKVSEDSTILKGIKAAAKLIEWDELRTLPPEPH